MHAGLTNTVTMTALSPFAIPWWQWVIIIVALAMAICFIIWFVIKAVKGRLKIAGVEIYGVSKNNNGDNPHATCEHRRSLGMIVKKIIDWTIIEHNIRTRGILSLQMMKAEEYLLSIKDKCLTTFSTKLKEKLKDNEEQIIPIHHADYLHYRLVMQEFIIKIKDIIRSACLNNGFTSMPDERYGKYVSDMSARIGSYSVRFFDENYIGNIIHITDMKDWKDLYTNIAQMTRDMFASLKRISIIKEKEISEIKDKRKAFIESEIGIAEL